jgi:cell wall-associated NlpC family hydrolase
MARMTGHAAFTATQTLDNSITAQAQEKAIVNQPRSDSGMGSVTQNGADTVTLDSMKAPDAPGAQAVGTTNPADAFGQNPNQSTQPQGGGTPTNAYTVARSMRYYATKQGQNYLGIPYVWGGGGTEGPSLGSGGQQIGFDCSGLVQYVLGQAGIKAPRLSYDQLAMGQRAAINSLLPGDLIGFGDGHHVAIWLGNGQILEAPHTGAAVRVRALDPSEDAWGVSLANLYH